MSGTDFNQVYHPEDYINQYISLGNLIKTFSKENFIKHAQKNSIKKCEDYFDSKSFDMKKMDKKVIEKLDDLATDFNDVFSSEDNINNYAGKNEDYRFFKEILPELFKLKVKNAIEFDLSEYRTIFAYFVNTVSLIFSNDKRDITNYFSEK